LAIPNPEEVAKISYASRSILPTLRTELPPTLVTMVAVLAGFGSAWLVEDLAHLHTDLVVLAVVLAVTLGRTHRSSDLRDRLTGAAVLPLAAAAAGGVGLLSDHHTVAGDTLFALAVAAAIWVRRFGPRFARAGTQATLPFIAILVTPVPPDSGTTHLLWAALMAVIAVGWVTVVQLAAQRAGLFAKPPNQSFTTPTPSSAARIPASTRMAVQMGVALGVAFWVGHRLFPDHWAWTVLTAYIVASGNRGRGDVVHKGALRIAGAAVGTVIATLLAGTFPAGDKWAVVVIFTILALATWLRPLSYAYWAGSVTAALSFLYGYFGESGSNLLRTRLEGIAYGAVIALAAAWWILPIKSRDVLRRRIADTLAALTDYLTAARRDPGGLPHHQARFDQALTQLDQVAAPSRTHRFLATRASRRSVSHPADAIPALHRCRGPIHTLTGTDPETLAGTEYATALATLLADVVTVRRAMKPSSSDAEPKPAPALIRAPPIIAELRTAIGQVATATKPH
jgi:Fusaric acid resistance protein-like